MDREPDFKLEGQTLDLMNVVWSASVRLFSNSTPGSFIGLLPNLHKEQCYHLHLSFKSKCFCHHCFVLIFIKYCVMLFMQLMIILHRIRTLTHCSYRILERKSSKFEATSHSSSSFYLLQACKIVSAGNVYANKQILQKKVTYYIICMKAGTVYILLK